MKRPTSLLCRVLLNEGLQTSTTVERDVQEIARRFEHEGMSYLTITLPSLCDALDQGLARGRIAPEDFLGFRPMSRRGRLPAFLSGFFIRVFEVDGALRDRPCIDSVRAIRQVTRLFKKVELPCSAARVKRAYERYESNDASLKDLGRSTDDLAVVAGYLWSDLETFARDNFYCAQGRFGTGATAERYRLNERHSIRQWPARGEEYFPLAFHGSHSEGDVETFDNVDILPEEREQPVRVVQVPKTLKTPRTISVEPSYMMLRQQSIMKVLVEYLESDRFKFTSIRFTDQTVNNRLAREGSLDGSLATIDLSDASDLVSNDLVKGIFGRACPTFLEYIQACRTTKALLPDKRVMSLRKFASMGSALCFPIEAMTFFTIVMMSLVRQSGQRPSIPLLKALSARVAVYGDDIIVPVETVSGVMEDLESYGLRVNHNKSFFTGFFRESCGGDYYKGHDVTPAYCRFWDFSGDSRDPRVLATYVSLSNQLYWKGLWNASQYIRDHLDPHNRRIARTRQPAGCYTFASVMFDTRLRWDKHLQGYRIKGDYPKFGSVEDPVQTLPGAMLRVFGSAPERDSQRLLQSSFGIVPAFVAEQPDSSREDSTRRTDENSSSGIGESCEAPSETPDLTSQLHDCGRVGEDCNLSSRANGGFRAYVNASSVDELGSLRGGKLCYPRAPRSSNFREARGDRMAYLVGRNSGLNLDSSIDSYTSSTKRKWFPVNTGMTSWTRKKV